MSTSRFDRLFATIQELVLCHSPSGAEAEIDQVLLDRFAALGHETWQDEAGNVIAKISGRNSQRAIAITAHKDEIGGIVKTVRNDGKVEVRRLGGAFPWVYGEGVVDLLGDRQTVSGILSFGSRHVSHESPQKVQQEATPVRWEDAWIETKRSAEELREAGIRPGTRMVIGKHRKMPFRLQDYIASYTLDNKASVAILLELAEQLTEPATDVYLVASAKEEMGAIGALYFTQHFTSSLIQRVLRTQGRTPGMPNSRLESGAGFLIPGTSLEALIALEICPLSVEYPIQDGDTPVVLSQDGYGIYDDDLNQQIQTAADQARIPVQWANLNGFGSDASIAMKNGHVGRAACLSFPTQNTHGYEIAHLGAIAHCTDILASYARMCE